MSDYGQPPGGGGFGQPPGGGGFGQPPPGGGGFGQPPGGAGGGGYGPPPGSGGFGPPPSGGVGQPPPGAGYGAPTPPKTETLALVSVITGGVGMLSCCCCLLVPLPIVALVTGALGLANINKDPNLKGKELAYVGIGLGAFALLITIGLIIFRLVTVGVAGLTQNPFEQGY